MSRPIASPMWVRDEPHPRVVVEAADPTFRRVVQQTLTEHGCSVRTCGGPEPDDERCPLVDGGHCIGVMGTDIVVHALRSGDPRNRAVLRNLRQRYPETPIVVEAPAPEVARHPEDYEGCHVVYQPVTRARLLESVDEALRAVSPG